MVRVALVAELSVTSDTSFEDAISGAIEEAKNNLGDVMSVWVKEQRANVTAGQVGQYQVNLLVTYTPLVWKPHVM